MDGARCLWTRCGAAASSETIERDLQQLRAMEPEDVGDCARAQRSARTPHLRATLGLGLGLMALRVLGVNTIMYHGAAILIMCGFEEKDSSQADRRAGAARGRASCLAAALGEVRAPPAPHPVGPGRGGGDGVRRPGFLGRYRHAQVRRLRRRHLPRRLRPRAVERPLVNAEIYPTRLRGLGQAACTANWTANYVVAATFLSLCGARSASTFALSPHTAAGAAWLHGACPRPPAGPSEITTPGRAPTGKSARPTRRRSASARRRRRHLLNL